MAPRSVAERAESSTSLKRAQAGDPAGFEELVHEHQAMVFSLACHFIGDRAAAEDLAQEVFLELFRSLARIESPAHLTFWLRRVTTHRCIDRFRRTAGGRDHLDLDPLLHYPAPESVKDILLEARLREIVSELPGNARAVMLLRYQEDLDPSDIASVLDMPLNTVKSHLRRSIDVIRARLGAKEQV